MANEIAVYALMNAIGNFFVDLFPNMGRTLPPQQLTATTQMQRPEVAEIVEHNPELQPQVEAMLLLGQLREEGAYEAILHSGAVGRSLRRRLTTEFGLIRQWIGRLLASPVLEHVGVVEKTR